MKVDEIPAGRELDALVAEKVMGWASLCTISTGALIGIPPQEDLLRDVPCFSADIKAAWEVVEQLKTRSGNGGWFSIELPHGDIVRAGFQSHLGEPREWRRRANADSAPLAICRSALKSAGIYEVPDES